MGHLTYVTGCIKVVGQVCFLLLGLRHQHKQLLMPYQTGVRSVLYNYWIRTIFLLISNRHYIKSCKSYYGIKKYQQ